MGTISSLSSPSTKASCTEAKGRALLGAQMFLAARLAYIPLDALAVSVVRSNVLALGWLGLLLMAQALF